MPAVETTPAASPVDADAAAEQAALEGATLVAHHPDRRAATVDEDGISILRNEFERRLPRAR